MNIRLKLVAYTLCIVLLVGGSISLYFVFEGQRRILDNFQNESQRITSVLANTIANHLYFLDVSSLRHRLEDALTNPQISYTYVTDLNGVVLADGTRANARRDQRLTDPFSIKALQTDTWMSSIDGESLKVGGPVFLADGSQVGYLQVGFLLDETHQLVREITQADLYLILLCLGVGGMLALALATSLSRPLLSVMRAAKDIGEGRFDTRVALNRRDELGTLAESINQMAEALQGREVEIERAQEILRTEQALRESEEHIRTIVNSVSVAISVKDAKGRFLFANKAYERIYGITEKAIRGKTPSEVLTQSEVAAERRLAHERRVIETRIADSREEKVALPDGSIADTLISKTPLLNVRGDVIGLCSAITELTEIKRAEQALRESEERYRDLVEGSVQGILIDRDRTPIFVNQSFVDILGYDSPAEILALDSDDPLFAPHERERLRAYTAARRRGEPAPSTYEVDALRKDGTTVTLKNIARVVNWDGQPAIQSTVIDITEEKRVQEALERAKDELEQRVQERTAELRKSGEQFRRLVETTHAIPWESDAESWLFTYVGPQAATVLGYPLDQWYDKDFWVNHIHPEDRDSTTDLCRRSSHTQDVYELEYRMLALNGKTVWVHDVVNVVRENGEPKTLRGFMIDITQRKQAEETLQALVEGTASQTGAGFFRSLVSNLATVLEVRHAVVGEFVDRHTKARTLAFWSGDCFVDNIEYPLVDTPCEQVLDGEMRHYPANVQALYPKDKDLVTLEAEGYLAVPMVSESGEVSGHLAVIDDEPMYLGTRQMALVRIFGARAGAELVRRRAERALRESEAALRVSEAELRKLTGDLLAAQEAERRHLARELHDDVTQRLAALSMDMAAIEQQQHMPVPSIPHELRDIHEKIVTLSSDIHRMSRRLHPSILDDLGLVKALRSECHNFSERHGIKVKFKHRRVPASLPGDLALCLYRIAQEGLGNIARHADSTDAFVDLVGVNGEIDLTIKDHGRGFSVPKSEGAGLGLVSMRERARLNGGVAAVHSMPGKGTTIEVRIPLRGQTK